MPTIKDIAKAAGVSTGTVSNVLNKREGVSYEKIRLVEETAHQLGFTLDAKASLLRKQSSNIIAVIIPQIESPRFADLYSGIMHYATEHGYDVHLYLTNDLPYREIEAIANAQERKSCMVLTVTCLTAPKKQYQAILKKKIPLLFLVRGANDASLASYTFDLSAAAAQFSQWVGSTPQSIKVISRDTRYANLDAFQTAIAQTMHLPKTAMYEDTSDTACTALYQMILQDTLPDVLIVSDQQLAVRCAMICAASGVVPPKIFALASLRPISDRRFYNVFLNYRNLGYKAVRDGIKFIEKKTPLSSVTLPISGHNTPYAAPAIIIPITLRVLAHESPTANALKLLSKHFTRETGVPVELVTTSLESVASHMKVSANGAWDVMRIDVSTLPFFAPDYLQPLDAFDRSVSSEFSRFLPNLENNYSIVNGHLYALPLDVSVQLLFYRKDILENHAQARAYYERTKSPLQVPTTYQELNDVARFFTRTYRSDSPIAYGTSVALGNATSCTTEFLPRLLEKQGFLYGENGFLDLSTPMAHQALREFVEFSQYASKEVAYDWDTLVDQFADGQNALSILYTNHAAGIMRTQKNRMGGKIGYATIPGGRPLLGGGALAISKYSKQPENAYRFLQWATSEELATEIVMLGGVSSCKCVYQQEKLLNTYPWMCDLTQNIALGSRSKILSPVPLHYNQRTFEQKLGEILLAALQRKLSVTDAMRAAEQIFIDV